MTTGRDPSPRQQQNGKAGKGSPSTGRQGGARAERAHRPPTGGDPEPLELDATRVAAVLFDLDGTLLELDMDQFLPVYLRRLAQWLTDLFEPEDFLRRLLEATTAVIEYPGGDRLNGDLLYERLWQSLDPDRHPGARPERRPEVLARLDRFYREVFPQLQSLARFRPEGPQVVAAARARGWKVVLATNPIFPRLAIEERMRWAGLDPAWFDLVTTLENMHTCKPRVDYYLEVAARIGLPPERCLMVGNDLRNDIAPARTAGMAVFAVDGLLLHQDEPVAAEAPRGTLGQLLHWIGTTGSNSNIFANPPTLRRNTAPLE